MKALKPLIAGLVIALVSEILIFNFRVLFSIGYEPMEVDFYTSVSDEGEVTTVFIDGLGTDVKSLYMDVDTAVNCPVSYSISLTDEGNFYEYALPEGHIVSSSELTKYTDIHAYGKVKDLRIEFKPYDPSSFSVNKISVNARKPFCFSVGRMMLIFILASAVLLPVRSNVKDKIREYVLMALCAAVLILFGFKVTNSHVLYNESTKPHQQQYKELAHALKEGRVYLPFEPSKELLNAPNPYDTIYLQANGIDYKADYVLYDGKYYVYFGIVPEILTYFPAYLLTGKDLPNHYAVFIFYTLFVLGVVLLYREIRNRFFPNVSSWAYLIAVTSTVLFGPVAYIYTTADLYSVPIMAGMALSVLGLFFYLKDKWLSGSLLMALVAGCRPQMVLFAALIVPLVIKYIKEKKLFSRESVKRTVCFILPYVVVALSLMYYNHIRFGNIFDFGATYSLTNNDMNLRGLSLSRMLIGLGTFLFMPPKIDGVFPFIHANDLSFSYMGRVVTEHFYGGIIVSNALTLSVFAIGEYKTKLRTKKLMIPVIFALIFSGVIGLFDASQAGILQRYTADMSLGIILVTCVMIYSISESLIEKFTAGVYYKASVKEVFLKLAFVLQAIYALLVIANADSGITLIKYDPELFYRLAALFRI